MCDGQEAASFAQETASSGRGAPARRPDGGDLPLVRRDPFRRVQVEVQSAAGAATARTAAQSSTTGSIRSEQILVLPGDLPMPLPPP
jgi:hypothetical protein